MKLVKYLILGIFFGIVLTKSEVISWFRIQEMFRFQSFHMYGVIGTAVMFGILWIQIIKRSKMKDSEGNPIVLNPKDKKFWRYILGGTIFGMGWALTGACPGPSFALVGYGYFTYIIAIFMGIVGTYVYGLLMNKLPQ